MSICVLLITILASMFSLNATTPVSTDDEELLDDNWELGIVFYDAAIGNGKTPLTEFNWHATEWTERKDIVIQINYKNGDIEVDSSLIGKSVNVYGYLKGDIIGTSGTYPEIVVVDIELAN